LTLPRTWNIITKWSALLLHIQEFLSSAQSWFVRFTLLFQQCSHPLDDAAAAAA
jgi:hypothetical protein